jgi:hypothetical protein
MGIVAVIGVMSVGCANQRENKRLEPSVVPSQVRASMEKRFPGAQVTRVEREKEHGDIVYDYELRQDGRKYEMDIKEDGTVLEVEKQLFGKDVPDVVARAVQEKYPKANVREVMEVDKVSGGRETPDHYEVTLSGTGAKGKEVIVSMDGRITEEGGEE